MKPSSLFEFLKDSFFSKNRHDYSCSLVAEKLKTVIIIRSVMIQGAFFFKTFFIKKSQLRVEFQGPRCIPDPSRGSARFTPLAWPPKKEKKSEMQKYTQTSKNVCFCPPIYNLEWTILKRATHKF